MTVDKVVVIPSGNRGKEQINTLQEKVLSPVRRVLIITGSAGGGHVSAACALEEKAAELGLHCMTIDALNASKFFRYSTQNLYEAFVRFAPTMWGVFYDFLERNKTALNMHTSFTTSNLGQLEDVIRDYRPDWIICTHDVALPKIATIRRYPHNFQLAVTVTDVHPHILWIEGSVQAGAEWIFVSSSESKANILSRSSIPAERIVVSGIPIGSNFSKPRPVRDLFKADTTPTILVTSGMIGAGRYLDVVRAISKLDIKVRLIVVCGRNEIIFGKLNRMAAALRKNTPHEYIIRGRVERCEMAQLLHDCTMIIAKPGGLTMSESMAAGCPFVIYEPFLIPGQEQKNAQFLLDNGIGVRAQTPKDLCPTVRRLLMNPRELDRLRANALASGKPHASHEILNTILQPDLEPVTV